ncbi:F-box protein-like protein [Tanacetum coccineum]
MPIITCDIHFGIHGLRSASSAEKWIKLVTSNTCLKELCLTVLPAIASYTLPDELFSSETLDKLSLKLDESKTYSLHISSKTVFNCVNLRALELRDVNISEYVLHKLLSTCKLLEKINLKLSEGLRKIQINNLRYLHELKIAACGYLGYLEISNVPCLRSLSYNETLIIWRPVSSNTDSIGSLRELCLNYVSMDDECSDMINSKFPFLESLTLTLICCHMETFDIRCVSLRRLTIRLMEKKQIKVQVCSPKLLFFSYECNTLPDFLFPSIAPEQFVLHMRMFNAIDDKFFLKLRDVLSLSSKFTIDLKCFGFMMPFDIDEVRRRIMFPATNVEYLLFETYDKVVWEKSLIIDVLSG